MYEQIYEKLTQAWQKIGRLQKVESMLVSLRGELSDLEEKERALKAALEKENRDLAKIEGKSVSSLFYSILGSREEQVEKERQEALAAELKYSQCVRDLEDVRFQMTKLEAEHRGLLSAQAEYDTLYREKMQMLLQNNGASAQRIMDLQEQAAASERNRREIGEAVSAGNAVLQSLESAAKSLDSAEGWGMWDLFGGGFVADLAKHSYIDDASAAAERTQSLLRSFRTELADVRISDDIQIDTGGFAKFADFFFDGLIADWFMQSKINASQESVRNVQVQVQGVLRRLGELEAREQQVQRELQAELDRLVVEM